MFSSGGARFETRRKKFARVTFGDYCFDAYNFRLWLPESRRDGRSTHTDRVSDGEPCTHRAGDWNGCRP